MDSDRFDDLTLALAEGLSRRGILRAAGGLAASGLALFGVDRDEEAAAKRRRRRRNKKKKKKCKGGKTRCNGKCVRLSSNDDHCGSCGNTCGSNESCQDGTCGNGNGNCTPNCQNKACGANDGCGGTCKTGTCPDGRTCQNGTCVCPFQCCANSDCAPNQNCVTVNDSKFCFCKPEQVCGQVCCPATTSCGNPGTSTCVS
jgi:hypothetical protein